MTQEEKNLLLKDLCARLQYNPIVEYSYKFEDIDKGEKKRVLTGRMIDSYFYNIVLGGTKVTSIKPYLRPMSSMTVVERKDLRRLTDAISIYNDGLEFESHDGYNDYIGYCFCSEIVDWLNAHHFDYYGLIPMGLALEAPEGMYKEE